MIFNKVYPFTNENLSAYSKLFDIKNKDILSVVGSGDQYFSFVLNGAKRVDLFDMNSMSSYYFALKFYAFRVLSYEEFLLFFVKSRLDDRMLYNKVRVAMPFKYRALFDSILDLGRSLSSITYERVLNCHEVNYSTGRVVPYFDKEAYYVLKNILMSRKFPRIYNVSLENLWESLTCKYDLMFFSNIFMYLDMDLSMYRDFLEKYLLYLKDNGKIEANYSWIIKDESVLEFRRLGFLTYKIPSVRYTQESVFEDTVFTLEKK